MVAASWSTRPVVLQLECSSESPARLVNPQIAESFPRVSDLVDLERSPGISIANNFPGAAAAAAGLGATL